MDRTKGAKLMPTYFLRLGENGEVVTSRSVQLKRGEVFKYTHVSLSVMVGIERAVIEKWARDFAREKLNELVIGDQRFPVSKESVEDAEGVAEHVREVMASDFAPAGSKAIVPVHPTTVKEWGERIRSGEFDDADGNRDVNAFVRALFAEWKIGDTRRRSSQRSTPRRPGRSR
jgi:hypothetical protein